jgi:predicted nucleotidyltransferase
MQEKTKQAIVGLLEQTGEVKLGIVFGSMARGTERADSDLDLAVAAERPLPAETRIRLIEGLAKRLGRPVDLMDLRTTGYFTLRQVLVEGEIVFCTNRSLLAEMRKRMVFEREDFAPYVDRALAARRKAWIGT